MRYLQHEVSVYRHLADALQNFITFEPLVKRRQQKCSRLSPETFKCLLWFNDEYTEEISRVDTFLKVRFLLADEVIETADNLMIIVLVWTRLTHKQRLFVREQFSEISDDPNRVAVEWLNQALWNREGM